VITARVAYSIQSRQADASEILVLAYGKHAAAEMRERLEHKLGSISDHIQVNTFHQLAMHILGEVYGETPKLSPLATNVGQKKAWFTQWLKEHWATDTNFKRWQKHLKQWPIAFLTGDDELGSQTANPKLLAWLEQQVEQLCTLSLKKKNIQEQLVQSAEYPRLNSELQLCWPCYQAWLKMLKDEQSIDFNSMITSATSLVNSGKFKPAWRKVMVDEYQDISPDRLGLLKAISQTNKQGDTPSVFAVGDDWQSIYQFAGSQIDLTTGFQSLFTHASVHALDRTYRCNSQITAVANQFVQQNPAQLSKSMTSQVNEENCAVFTLEETNLELLLNKLNRDCDLPQSVLLLGRNNYHKPKQLKQWQLQFTQLKLDFLTCHASKGQEADNVVILSCNEKEFPAKQRTEHLKEYLTKSTDTFEYAEERRLFYVALTRARSKVYITHSASPSVFVTELRNGHYNVKAVGGRKLAK
jgi:DNA helicase-4